MKSLRIKQGLAVLVVVLMVAAIGGCGKIEEPIPRGAANVLVYTEQGGAKLVVASGGEIEVQSGGTLDLQAGATTDFSSGVDLDGGTLIMDADADTTLLSSYDDIITLTLGAATGRLDVLTGNIRLGNGTPGETHNGEDLYVEGISEFDGQANFDGVLDADGAVNITGVATFGVDGTAADVIFYSDTTGDSIRYYQADERLIITGTANQVALTIADGDLSVTDRITVAGTLDAQGNVADSGGAFTVADNVMIDGAADVIQLTVHGHSAQTSNVFVVEGDDYVDQLSVSNAGLVTILGGLDLGSTSITVTVQTITPTYSLYRLNAAATATVTLAACSLDGQLLYLYGEDAVTVSIVDSNILTHDGAAWSIGQYDMVAAMCVATKWVQIVEVANS